MKQVELPISSGDDLRDASIASVLKHNMEWFVVAEWMVKKHCAGVEMSGEDIRKMLEAFSVVPDHHNGLGALIFRLSSSGILEDTGRTTHAEYPSSHSRRLPIWLVVGDPE